MERRNDGGGGSGGKIKIGVCVMEKKVSGCAFGETRSAVRYAALTRISQSGLKFSILFGSEYVCGPSGACGLGSCYACVLGNKEQNGRWIDGYVCV